MLIFRSYIDCLKDLIKACNIIVKATDPPTDTHTLNVVLKVIQRDKEFDKAGPFHIQEQLIIVFVFACRMD